MFRFASISSHSFKPTTVPVTVSGLPRPGPAKPHVCYVNSPDLRVEGQDSQIDLDLGKWWICDIHLYIYIYLYLLYTCTLKYYIIFCILYIYTYMYHCKYCFLWWLCWRLKIGEEKVSQRGERGKTLAISGSYLVVKFDVWSSEVEQWYRKGGHMGSKTDKK